MRGLRASSLLELTVVAFQFHFTCLWFCFLVFEGVGQCVNKVTELFTYDIHLGCDLISSHKDVVRNRVSFSTS